MAGSNFVDYVKIYCRSGKGGAGSLHFRREKYIPKGGPDGGDGGRGGNIILRGNAQMWTLLHLRYTKHLMAEDGVPGGSNQLTGAAGKDVFIDVPLGTVAYEAETRKQLGEITEDGQTVVLLISKLPPCKLPNSPNQASLRKKCGLC
jgi:GTP-binding protein